MRISHSQACLSPWTPKQRTPPPPDKQVATKLWGGHYHCEYIFWKTNHTRWDAVENVIVCLNAQTLDAPSPPPDKQGATRLLSKQIQFVYKTPSAEKIHRTLSPVEGKKIPKRSLCNSCKIYLQYESNLHCLTIYHSLCYTLIWQPEYFVRMNLCYQSVIIH